MVGDFRNISYLKAGTEKQQRVFEIVTTHRVLTLLESFDPVLAGTIPINIDIDGSDLDILCCWSDKRDFIARVTQTFGHEKNFTLRDVVINNVETVIANFLIAEFEFEVFGQPIPVATQHGYRHMLVEHHILETKGEAFRKDIIALKQRGYKTELAFAQLLGLKGDPYDELLLYTI